MREVGAITQEEDARRFADYLFTLGIRSKLEPSNGFWSVWVYDEERVKQGGEELVSYLADPQAAKYSNVAPEARRLRMAEAEQEAAYRQNVVQVRSQWRSGIASGPKPATYIFMAACVLVAMASRLGEHRPVVDKLQISQLPTPARTSVGEMLPEVRRGEAWRLFTPALLHFGPVHLVFNLLWLVGMGGLIEIRRGSAAFTALVVTIGMIANLAQYFFEGPNFGGMSGVGFGLFGYALVKQRLAPEMKIYVGPRTTFIMFAWLLICIFQKGSHAANAAHIAGLVSGMVLAWAPLLGKRGSR